ncbi:MAG: hypothetical protein ACTS43_00090 [Candidatus Hodgkinia cicadicola]
MFSKRNLFYLKLSISYSFRSLNRNEVLFKFYKTTFVKRPINGRLP